MNSDHPFEREPHVLELSPRQREVFDALRARETSRYRLSNWYQGVLYALANPNNPDRIAQAAHSMRELVEKIPRVFETDAQGGPPNFKERRRKLHSRFMKEKERYPDGWKGNRVNAPLNKILLKTWEYLELSELPSRREQIQTAVEKTDPLAGQLDQKVKDTRRDQFFKLWKKLEKIAHHQDSTDLDEISDCLMSLESMVLDLLSPISALDQQEILSILNRFDNSDSDARRMLELIERGDENYDYFFKHVSDAAWIPILEQNGYFSDPPGAEPTEVGTRKYPIWAPIRYLASVAKLSSETVVEVLQDLPAVENPWVYDGILDAALQLSGEQSILLKKKMLEYSKLDFHVLAYRFSSLTNHWTEEDQTAAALDLASELIQFKPDPNAESKGSLFRKDPSDWTSYLDPSPRFESWDYRDILDAGVRPLARKEPYHTACMLINAVTSMISLRMHPEQQAQGGDGDASDVWCRRLSGPSEGGADERETLAQTLTFACQHVYESATGKVANLDDRLRNQRWRIFKRLRQHLYARYPSEQTKPWIRELILSHKDYDRSEHHFEFQLMVRSACEHFGEELLTKQERTSIFDTILKAPSREDLQELLGEGFTEEKFEARQVRFHRMQFRLFEKILFGHFRTRYLEVESRDGGQVSDEDYGVGKAEGGFISTQSPRSPDELAEMGDEKVLAFLNEWDIERRDKDNWLVEITIEGLAEAFQTFFKDFVMLDVNRLKFWIKNRGEIDRPIYVRAIVDGMKDLIENKSFERLGESLEFCGWVLSHHYQEREDDIENGDKSRENPSMSSSRRAVVDLVGTCIEREVNVPYSYREQLTSLLATVCTAFDWRLDQNKPVLLSQNDQLAEAINNTRSRALEILLKLGTWMRNHDPNSNLDAVTKTLERRFSPETEHALTLPEYAILGLYYARLLSLDRAWATSHRSSFFPQKSSLSWREAFGNFLSYTRPHEAALEVLRDEYDFAIQNVVELSGSNDSDREFSDYLGHHLFSYYMWGLIPLTGETGHLERFYQHTESDRNRWGNLFEYVGIGLGKVNKRLEGDLETRIHAYFEWRLEAGEPSELGRFYWWLEAECLNPEWRLDAFSRVLDATKESAYQAISIVAKCLEQMLPGHTSKVIECFAKLTDAPKDSKLYVEPGTAKRIIQSGLGSSDEETLKTAKQALDNLIQRGFDLQSLK